MTKDAAVGATTLIAVSHLFGIQQGTAGHHRQRATPARPSRSPPCELPTTGRPARSPSTPALAQEVRVARGDMVEIAAPPLADRQAATDPANATATSRAGTRGLGKRRAGTDPAVGALGLLPTRRGHSVHDPADRRCRSRRQTVASPRCQDSTRRRRRFRSCVQIGQHRFWSRGRRFQASNAGPLTRADIQRWHPAPARRLDRGLAVRRLRPASAAGHASCGSAGARRLYPGAIVELDNGTQQRDAARSPPSAATVVTFNTRPGR